MHKLKGVSFAQVKSVALALPEVAESTSYGTQAFKVRGKLMLRLREDNDTLVIRTSWENRERLMILEPEVYFLTDHHRAYPRVLAKLSSLSADVLPGLVASAWREAALKSVLKKSTSA